MKENVFVLIKELLSMGNIFSRLTWEVLLKVIFFVVKYTELNNNIDILLSLLPSNYDRGFSHSILKGSLF